ncbi:hypothetical protein B9G55_05670 [Saccharibacillus sp. O16]|nr:hypothetical protein B9G55_05670 [Saccharibacillus sp. O16]
MKKISTELLLIAVGAFAFALGINVFVIPHGLGEGGVVGVTVILYYVLHWSPGLTGLVINLALVAVGYKLLSRKTIAYTIVAVSFHSLLLHLTEHWRIASSDLMVNAIFGGAMIGLGIGLIIRAGGTTAGTVIIAQLMHKFWGWKVSYALLLCDALVAISSYFIIGIEKLMFTIIMLVVATKVIDMLTADQSTSKSVTVMPRNRDEAA